MDLLQFIGAIGLGAIFIKLLDIFYVQRRTEESEHLRWIRDNKLQAFTTVTEILLPAGATEEGYWNPFNVRSHLAKAYLLIEDRELRQRLDRVYIQLNDYYTNEETVEVSENLVVEIPRLIDDLRNDLLKSRTNTCYPISAEQLVWLFIGVVTIIGFGMWLFNII